VSRDDDVAWICEVADLLAELGAKPSDRTRRLLWDAAGCRTARGSAPHGRGARGAAEPLYQAWLGTHRVCNEEAGLRDRDRWEAREVLLDDASTGLRSALGMPRR
jgi:hypothetical protein